MNIIVMLSYFFVYYYGKKTKVLIKYELKIKKHFLMAEFSVFNFNLRDP